MSTPDPEQDATYFAEDTVFEGTLFDVTVTDADIQTLAEELFGSDWWQSQGIPMPSLSLRRLEAQASHARSYHPWSDKTPEIRFCVSQVNPHILAHEAAHVAADHLFATHYNSDIQAHGPEFRATYLAVAKLFLGERAADDLSSAFNKYTKPLTAGQITLADPDNVPYPEGIFPRWRNLRNIEEMRRITAENSGPERIAGAIAL